MSFVLRLGGLYAYQKENALKFLYKEFVVEQNLYKMSFVLRLGGLYAYQKENALKFLYKEGLVR